MPFAWKPPAWLLFNFLLVLISAQMLRKIAAYLYKFLLYLHHSGNDDMIWSNFCIPKRTTQWPKFSLLFQDNGSSEKSAQKRQIKELLFILLNTPLFLLLEDRIFDNSLLQSLINIMYVDFYCIREGCFTGELTTRNAAESVEVQKQLEIS